MIPNCIHFIFFGFTQFEYIHYLAVKSAHTVHRPDHIYLYYTTKPANNPLWDEIESLVTLVQVDPPEEFNGVPLDSFQYRADVLRLQLLIKHGGIYLDIDAVSLKPFGDLVNHSCVLGIESGGDTLDTAESISNAVILAEPNHPFIVDWLEQTGQNLKDQHWAYHAVNLPVEMLKSKDYAVHLEPKQSFMPFGWRDQWVWEPGNQSQLADSYTMHLWETIWKDQLKIISDDYLLTVDNCFTKMCKKYARSTMPSSSQQGKYWTEHTIQKILKTISIENILDIGAGEGTYLNLYKSLVPTAHWTAIEVWSNYIEKYSLKEKYDVVINRDVRQIQEFGLSHMDLVFAGDVLEHMTKEQAVELVDHILTNHKSLIISIPVVHMPQGEFEGNPYEEHIKDDWSDNEMKQTFGNDIIADSVDFEIGVYLLSRDQDFIKKYQKLKIAIYTICKNENDFVDRWAASNSEADYRLVCDTGSADNTVELLKSHDVNVIPIGVDPWRFDVARNTALNLLPSDIDICIWQDLDEELLPGWRNSIERNWASGTTIANHKYRHNNGAWQWHSKIHARHGCWWTGAVHEELRWNCEESAIWLQDFFLDEHQDIGKSRTSYLDLLLKKINEGDDNWRTYSFLAVEYQRVNDLINTVKYRKISYDAYTESDAVKSYLARVLGNAHSLKGDAAAAEKWFKIATEHGCERESWFALAEHYYRQKQWDLCYIAAKTCLTIDQRCDGFTFDPRAWDSLAYDYAALSAYYLGITSQAVTYGKQAVALNPADQRLIDNLKLYEQS